MTLLLALMFLGQTPAAVTPESLPAAADSSVRDTLRPAAPAKGGPGARAPGAPADWKLPADSLPPESLDVVYYGGKRVIFDAESSIVYLLDTAWVRYKDMSLRSDSIIYDIRRNLLSSYRLSRFTSASDSVVGQELHYNVDTRKGYMMTASTQLAQGFFDGNNFWLVEDKVLDVNYGAYTTCDREKPHYSFWGKRIKVYLDDVVIVEPLVLKIGSVPVLAAPFWFFPIGSKRKSGLLPPKVGNSSTEGLYAKNISYYWAINDYADATFVMDVMTKKGLRWSGEGIYAYGPYLSGSLLGSYIRESDTKIQRYSLAGNHSSRFLLGTRLNARVDFQSDNSFATDYSEDPTQWRKSELLSYASINRSFGNLGSGTLTAQRRVDLQTGTDRWDFPTLVMNLNSIRIFKDWNLNSGLSAANSREDRTVVTRDSAGAVLDSFHETSRSFSATPSFSLTLPQSLFGGLTLPLNGGYSEGQVNHIRNGEDSLVSRTRRANAGTGLGFSQTLFGFLGVSEGFGYGHALDFGQDSVRATVNYSLTAGSHFALNKIYPLELLGLHGMLHRATPSVSYSYVPRARSRGYYGVPRFDTLPASSRFGLNLANDFQIKYGADKIKRDIGNLNFGSGYDLTDTAHRFQDISASFDLNLLDRPDARLTTSGGTSFNPYEVTFGARSLTTAFSYSFVRRDSVRMDEQSLALALDHFVSWQDSGESRVGYLAQHMLTGSVTFIPRGWNFVLSGSWNIKEKKVTDWRLDLVKDLHCWELLAGYTRRDTRWSYDFKIRIKAIPDVNLGKGLFDWALPGH